ncbi:hypothetical protein [Streptomyces sp. NPDC015130]|uniref:hypothetical protein n=1 Tax=Streptomyces sp. NPDC015130 TaxID=3364940 RepID=UPI0036FC6052
MRRFGTSARTRRGCLAALLGGAVMLASAGCSPAQRPLVAVHVDERGVAHALLRSCDDDGRVRGPALHGTVPRPTPTSEDVSSPEGAAPEGAAPEESAVAEPWIGWEALGTHEAADFPLFEPPSSWAAEARGPRSPQPGRSYELSFADPDDSYAYTGTVTFDAGQLAKVRPGDVLTLRGTMTKEEFEDLAREAC